LISTAVRAQGQESPTQEYLAFRVDNDRLIATVLIRDATPPQILLLRSTGRAGTLLRAPIPLWIVLSFGSASRASSGAENRSSARCGRARWSRFSTAAVILGAIVGLMWFSIRELGIA
jgi:hypothetical protein